MINTHPLRAAAIGLLLVAFNHGQAQYNAENLTPTLDANTEARFSCEKLRLYPIIANETFRMANSDIGKAVPMNKALADGRLKINELAGGATVNTLQAINTSTDTIYLMQGEVIVGGKQDRMLANDVLVAPGATMDIAAFCVEHGRWSANGDGRSFTGTVGVVAQDVRKVAAVERQQEEVWDKVAYNVTHNAAEAPTGSYADMLEDKEYQAQRAAYRERLKDLPATYAGIVGVIAVSGDKVVGCDVFANEALFTQAYPQLIDAYIAEALNKGGTVTMTSAQVQSYFRTLFVDEKTLEEKSKGNGYLFKAKDRTYRVSMF
jgi:hypothetical protein